MVKRPEFFGPIHSLSFLSTDKIVKIVYTLSVSIKMKPLDPKIHSVLKECLKNPVYENKVLFR